MGLIISLIVIGMVLMLTEIMLIPGVGVAGILGFLSIGGACYLAFCEFGTMTGIIVLASNAIVLVLLLIWVLRAQTWKKFTLNTNIDSKAVSTETVIAIGDFAKTVLMPGDPLRAKFIAENFLKNAKLFFHRPLATPPATAGISTQKESFPAFFFFYWILRSVFHSIDLNRTINEAFWT